MWNAIYLIQHNEESGDVKTSLKLRNVCNFKFAKSQSGTFYQYGVGH